MKTLPTQTRCTSPKIKRGFAFLCAIMKRELRRSFTILLIPHNSIKPFRLSFSLSFLVFLLFAWTGFTLWAGYLSSQHIDYWRVRADHKLMKLKVTFFAEQVRKSQEMLEKVQENDAQVRALLEMKSRKAIIESEGRGGPTGDELKDLDRVMQGKVAEMTEPDISRQTKALMDESKAQLDSFQEVMQYVDQERAVYHSTPNIWPCIGRVTSTFGNRVHPLFQDVEFHSGLDIANDKNTPIYATANGQIRVCDWQPGYGRLIVMDHGYGYTTYYGHLCKILVKVGERVRRGQLIGLMGSTGTSTGNHVHYEVRYNGRLLNPVRFLKTAAAQTASALVPTSDTR